MVSRLRWFLIKHHYRRMLNLVARELDVPISDAEEHLVRVLKSYAL